MGAGNVLLSSEALDNATDWVRTQVAGVTANATADPFGGTGADKVLDNATATVQHFLQQTWTRGAVQTQQTASVYFKAAEYTTAVLQLSDGTGFANVSVNLSNGTATGNTLGTGVTRDGQGADSVGNGWYRAWVTATFPAATTQSRVQIFPNTNSPYTGTGTSGIYVFGAQLTGGLGPPPYNDTPAAVRYRRMGVAARVR